MSIRRAHRNANRRVGDGEHLVSITDMIAAGERILETQRADREALADRAPLTFDRSAEFALEGIKARPTAGVDAQLAEAMRISRGAANPKLVRDMIRRLRNG